MTLIGRVCFFLLADGETSLTLRSPSNLVKSPQVTKNWQSQSELSWFLCFYIVSTNGFYMFWLVVSNMFYFP